ncbi:hypothetical protein BH18THE2_BH18THE2_21920 [soil metagenome]
MQKSFPNTFNYNSEISRLFRTITNTVSFNLVGYYYGYLFGSAILLCTQSISKIEAYDRTVDSLLE